MTDTAISTARPSIALVCGSLFRADFTVLTRNYRTVLLNFAVPLIFLIATDLHPNRQGAASSFASGSFDIGIALTFGLMSSSVMGYSLTVARDRDAGVFQRLRVTPAPTWAIMTSRLVVQLILDLIMTVVVVVIGTVMHHLNYTVGDYLVIGCISLLGGIVFLAIGQAVVGLVRSAVAVSAVGRLLYILFIIFGLTGSSGILGSTVQSISQWSPVGAMLNLYEGILAPQAVGSLEGQAFLVCAIYIVIGTFIGIRWFRWEAR